MSASDIQNNIRRNENLRDRLQDVAVKIDRASNDYEDAANRLANNLQVNNAEVGLVSAMRERIKFYRSISNYINKSIVPYIANDLHYAYIDLANEDN